MKNQTKYKYAPDADVIEFYKFDNAEFQPMLDAAIAQYDTHIESLYYTERAANVEFKRYQSAVSSLQELAELTAQGYTPKYAEIAGLSFNVVLRKPEKVILTELGALREEVTEEYETLRYQRNVDYTEYQVSLTLQRNERERHKALADEQAAIEAQRQVTADAERQAALADLLAAYNDQEAA